jgi:hypothetical protein
MSDLDDVVTIILTRESTAIATASFEIPLIIAEFATTIFPERTRVYTNIDAVGEDFDSTDAAYVVANRLFSQSTVGAVPATIVIGRKDELESWVEAYEAIKIENDSFYGVVIDSKDAADQEALSDAIQADRRILGISTADTAAPTTATTDIGAILSAKSAGRTYGICSPTAATEHPEAAWMGSQMPYTPGSNDWDFKRAVGVTVSSLSDTAKLNLRNKNYNFYSRKGGVNVFQDGNMFDGTPIDQVIGEDWLYARLQEGIYFRIINSLKIPMTNPGLAIVETEIRSVLAQAQANGLIDAGWTVSVPDVLSIPETMRAQRTAGVFVFRARLAGSIRKVNIQGFLSV